MTDRNGIEFRLWGRYALFTDPLTRIGGEKCSYHVPTYEALKGVVKSIYWKPTLIWYIDEVRVMRRIRTQTKGTKPLAYGGGHDLSIYTFLTGDCDPATGVPGVEYQVRAHFEWNEHRPELEPDRIEGKHFAIAKRMLERGGRQDIFLGTRDCQGYVEPYRFGEGPSAYDGAGELGFGLMFHSFGYPDETGAEELHAHFWCPTMVDGQIEFPRPEGCRVTKVVRPMTAKRFGIDENLKRVEAEATEMGA
ncbi:MAG: type I-C CRISPR-associated protein Cas5c [Bryobacteraceae bacterium]